MVPMACFRATEATLITTAKKLRGIYKRGNIFWFNQGSGAARIQLTLETGDYEESVQKALLILK